MRPRLLLAVLGLGVLAGGSSSATAALASDPAAPAVPEVYEARAVAGGVHDSISVPAYFETFSPYSLSEASNGAVETS